MATFGEMVRTVRSAQDVSLEKLSKMTKVALSTLWKQETNRNVEEWVRQVTREALWPGTSDDVISFAVDVLQRKVTPEQVEHVLEIAKGKESE